jgi:hypothetical protein
MGEVRSRGTTELALADRTLEEFSVSYRSIDPTETLLPLAGVLLGKTSLDWLYGRIGELPQTVSQFWRPDSAGYLGLAAAPNE